MRKNNRRAVHISSFFMGIACAFCIITSYQNILPFAQGPMYFFLALAISAFGLSTYVNLVVVNQMKFIIYSSLSIICLSSVFYLLRLGFLQDFTTNISWFGIAFFSAGFFHWVMNELSIRYVHPESGKLTFGKSFFYFEIGSIAGILIYLRMNAVGHYSNFDILKYCGYLYAIAAGVQLYQFLNKNNFEIDHTPEEINDPNKEKHAKLLKVVLPEFLILCTGIGLMLGYSFSYFNHTITQLGDQGNLIIQDKNGNILASVILISSIVICSLGYFQNKWINNNKISPYKLYKIFLISHLVLLAPSILFSNIFYACVLVIMSVALFKILIMPANHLWLSFIALEYQKKYKYLRTVCQLCVPFSLLCFTYNIPKADYALCVLVGAFGLLILKNLTNKHSNYLISLLNSKDPIEVLVASDGLGYLRPENLKTLFLDHLKIATDDHIKTTLISGLSLIGNDNDFETMKHEFFHGTLIVQMSIIEAFTQRPTNQKVEFLIDLVVNKEYQNLSKIRSFASKNLGRIYGKQIVPILLWEVKHDPRVQANILEVLAELKDPSLDSLFINFIKNKVPRLKAIGILGLYHNHPRSNYTVKNELDWMLEQEDDPSMIASALYVIGKAGLKKYENTVLSIERTGLMNNARVERTVAYALSCFGNETGIKLFSKYFTKPFVQGVDNEFMHFFSQLGNDVRFEILSFYIKFYGFKDGQLENAMKYLKYASIDLHAEIQFMTKAHAV